MTPLTIGILVSLSLLSLVFGLSQAFARTSLQRLDLGADRPGRPVAPVLPSDAPLLVRIVSAFSYRLYGEVSLLKYLADRATATSAAMDRLLAQAGRPYGLTAENLAVMGVVGPIGCGAGATVLALVIKMPWFIGAAMGVAVGLYPRTYVTRLARTRSAKIRRALPGMLDLLVMAAEAGMTPEAGITLVARETDGPLGVEMSIVAEQIKANIDALEAFRQLAERTQVEEVESFVQALITATRFSRLSYEDALDKQSARLRSDLHQETATQVRALMVKILLPLALFFLPSILLILLGPALTHLSGL